MYPKNKFTGKHWYAMSTAQLYIFWEIFFAGFELLMFHNNTVKKIRKIEQTKLVENLLPSYLPYRSLHNLHSFLQGKSGKYLCFKKPLLK